jgi:hypothetical protein
MSDTASQASVGVSSGHNAEARSASVGFDDFANLFTGFVAPSMFQDHRKKVFHKRLIIGLLFPRPAIGIVEKHLHKWHGQLAILGLRKHSGLDNGILNNTLREILDANVTLRLWPTLTTSP